MADRLDLKQLRAAMDYGWKDWHYGDSLRNADIGALDTILGAARWLLSLLEEGGRVVVEAPCEHGVFNPHYDGGSGLGCGGSFRKVVWPEEHQ